MLAPLLPGQVAYALAENGGLYMLDPQAAIGIAPDLAHLLADDPKDRATSRWEHLGDVGMRHKSIAVDCGYLYGVNESLGVDFQRLKGATADRWTCLAKGYVISIAVWDGTVYGVGRAEGGDRVYCLVRTAGAWTGQPWECTSGGRCLSIAAAGAHIYAIGVDNWVYCQPLSGMSEKTKWKRAFPAGGLRGDFAVLDAGGALGVGVGGRVSLFDSASHTWAPGPEAGLPCGIIALAAAGGQSFQVQLRPPLIALPAPEEEEVAPQEVPETQMPTERRSAALGAQTSAAGTRRLPPTPTRALPECCCGGETWPPLPPSQAMKPGVEAVLRQAVRAPAPGYLSLEAGAVVEVVYLGAEADPCERGWLFARPVGKATGGWLPLSAVAPQEGTLAAEPQLLPGLARVHRAVLSAGPGFLSLAAGEEVTVDHVGSEASEDSGWLYGRNAADDSGWFPAAALGP